MLLLTTTRSASWSRRTPATARKTVLGTKPSLLLHEGTSKKDPVLAATGETSRLAAGAYAFGLESIVLMPPARDGSSDARMTTEHMYARTDDGDDVAFSFWIEIGSGEK